MRRMRARVSTTGRFRKATTRSPVRSPEVSAGVSLITSTTMAPKPSRDAVARGDLVHLLLGQVADADPEPAPALGGGGRAACDPSRAKARSVPAKARRMRSAFPQLLEQGGERREQSPEPPLDVRLLEQRLRTAGVGISAEAT